MPTNYAGVDTSFAATVPIIADGEALSEKNLAPGIRTLADQNAYVKRVLPTVYSFASDLASGSIFWTYDDSGSLRTTVLAGGKVDVAGCKVGDKILVSASIAYAYSDTTAFDAYLDAIDDEAGTAVQSHVPGAHWNAANGIDANDSGRQMHMHLSGTWTVAVAGTTRLTFAFVRAGTTGQFDIRDAFNISAIRIPVP